MHGQRPSEFSYSRSGYKGVTWQADHQKFVVRIGSGKNGLPRKRIGYFETAVEAAQAYDRAAIEIYGREAVLNFPLEGEAKAVAAKNSASFGKCIRGHKLIETGYQYGGRTHCRECNRLAYHRLKARRVSRTVSEV